MAVTCDKRDEMLAPADRTIRPRIRKLRRMPVIAISGDVTLNEHGETGTVDELVTALPQMSPTLFARLSAADFIARIDVTLATRYPDSWQWQVSSQERDILRPDGVRVAGRVTTLVRQFGFKGGNYHRIIDPIAMYGRSLDTVWPGDEPTLHRMLKWAVAIRNFCNNNGVEVRASMGAIGSQFLTDPRFYPARRRKVPTPTNDQAREHLVGNYYKLRVPASPNTHFTAHYLDQSRAHHYHAQTVALPDANHLYAHGRFTDLGGYVFQEPWPDFYGLYCLDMVAPDNHEQFRILHGTGPVLEKQFVYSHELEPLWAHGYRVLGVRAAWGSRHRDQGIPQYAAWACQQLDLHDDAPWIKPILLSTYGTLATRPESAAETIFRLAKRGAEKTLRTGKYSLTGTAVSYRMDPRIGNVLQRGLIEAGTRSDSIECAHWLLQKGHQVLSIYADAVIVRADDDKPLPLLPEPWRIKETLTHLQFINQQAFLSDSMTKLPGVGRDIIAYRQRTPGHAPRKVVYEALTGRAITTNRRI